MPLFTCDLYMFSFLQFLDQSKTPYAAVPVNQPNPENDEEPEINPSASLNDWLLFPSSQDLEVCFTLCCFTLYFLLHYYYLFAILTICKCYHTLVICLLHYYQFLLSYMFMLY